MSFNSDSPKLGTGSLQKRKFENSSFIISKQIQIINYSMDLILIQSGLLIVNSFSSA